MEATCDRDTDNTNQICNKKTVIFTKLKGTHEV